MTNFFKNPKNQFWGHSGLFLPKFGPKMNFPGKKGSASFSIFKLSTIVPKIIKSNEGIPEKTVGQTHQKPAY